jgi:hypothetical protein
MNDDEGNVYFELVACLSVFLVIILLTLTHYHNTVQQIGRTTANWHVFWTGKEAMETWKAGQSGAERVTTFGVEVTRSEKWLSDEVQEGVFTLKWKEGQSNRSVVFYAYRTVLH